MPSGYECPRVPLLLKKMVFGAYSAPNEQASARRRSASTAPSDVGMQSPDEAPTKGRLPKEHRRTAVTSSIVLTREGSLTKRIQRTFG